PPRKRGRPEGIRPGGHARRYGPFQRGPVGRRIIVLTVDFKTLAGKRRRAALAGCAGFLVCVPALSGAPPATQPALMLAQAAPAAPIDEAAPAGAAEAPPEQVTGEEVTQGAAVAETPAPRKPLMRLFDAVGLAEPMDELGINAFG